MLNNRRSYFDIETGSADDLWRYGPGFVRLIGLGDDDETVIAVAGTAEGDAAIELIDKAETIVGHNILGFDLLALCRYHGLNWADVAAKAVDTELIARLEDPPVAREGYTAQRKRYDLSSVAQRHGHVGKTDDVRKLARKHGGYDKIPVDNEQYRDYLRGDIAATRHVGQRAKMTDYARREHRIATIAGYATLEGFRVDEQLIDKRIEEGRQTRRDAIGRLHDRYGLPLENDKGVEYKSPIATSAGKATLAEALWNRGVDVPLTEKTGVLDTSKDSLAKLRKDYADSEEVVEICDLIGTANGVRTVYQTAKDYTVDGRVHPMVSMRQASGRWSVTKPGMTVFGKRGGRVVEREIFLPEPGHVLIAVDLDQVDMRAIAGHCQDPAYMRLFEPGRDAHGEIAQAVFGTVEQRDRAKACGHGWNYGLSVNGLVRNGVPRDAAIRFDRGMRNSYPVLDLWRGRIRELGEAGYLLDNGFGRKMRCDPDRAWTQAPALMGQGGARDIMMEALLRLPEWILPHFRVLVHDELVFSVPEKWWQECADVVVNACTMDFRGVPITAGVSRPGETWAGCYA